MNHYDLTVQIWQQRTIQNDAEIAEVLNRHSIALMKDNPLKREVIHREV